MRGTNVDDAVDDSVARLEFGDLCGNRVRLFASQRQHGRVMNTD